jgi:hypothetical protein
VNLGRSIQYILRIMRPLFPGHICLVWKRASNVSLVKADLFFDSFCMGTLMSSGNGKRVGTRSATCARTTLWVFSFGSLVFSLLGSPSRAYSAEMLYIHPSPNGIDEFCAVPSYYETSDLKYVDLDSDREDEQKLCRLTLYEGFAGKVKIEKLGNLNLTSFPGKEVVACPKFNSTNPGTNFVEIPRGMSHSQAKSEFCVPKSKIDGEFKEDYDLEAKFKSTISCSSTASSLGYYHLSRLLGGAGRVPVAVYRTMSRDSHQKIATEADAFFNNSSESTTVIAKTPIAINWRNFLAASKDAEAGRPNAKLYIEAGRLLFGSLQKNLKGEDKYTEVSGVGTYEGRYARFLQQRPFQLVADSRSIEKIIGEDFFEMVQTIVQMQDVSDMVLLDTIMSQDDRIGNIHVKPWVLEKGSSHLRKLQKSEELVLKEYKKQIFNELKKRNPRAREVQFNPELAKKATPVVFPQGQAVIVAAMHLKDNDCGTDVDLRGNEMRRHRALESVRHLSPETYRRFLKFAAEVDSGRFKRFALESLGYREKDYEGTRYSMRENVRHAAKVLVEACEKGDLKLDLDLRFDPTGRFRSSPPIACR